MRREASPVRPDFPEHAKQIGFAYASDNGEQYWDESARYLFTLRQIEQDIEPAVSSLYALCLEMVGRVIANDRLKQWLRIPRFAWRLISESWDRRDPSLYGRFDFTYDGERPPKLLEFNADTPTSLYESAVVQWYWLEAMIARGDIPADADQFNSLHEKLVARWREIDADQHIHFACMSENVEDLGTVTYLSETARAAGLSTSLLDMQDIRCRHNLIFDDVFEDMDRRPIKFLFKLYPWEWMLADPFGKDDALRRTRLVEPAWKAILSNKGILALLYDFAPDHPNLLPCYFENAPNIELLGESFVRKPIFSREGANVTLVRRGQVLAHSTGTYGSEGYIRQALSLLPDFAGYHPVVGAWVVGDQPAGIGIREDISLVTTNRSRFVPHLVHG